MPDPKSSMQLSVKSTQLFRIEGSCISLKPSCCRTVNTIIGRASPPNVARTSCQPPRRRISQVIVTGIDCMADSTKLWPRLIGDVRYENLIERQSSVIDYGCADRLSGPPELLAFPVADVGPLAAVSRT